MPVGEVGVRVDERIGESNVPEGLRDMLGVSAEGLEG